MLASLHRRLSLMGAAASCALAVAACGNAEEGGPPFASNASDASENVPTAAEATGGPTSSVEASEPVSSDAGPSPRPHEADDAGTSSTATLPPGTRAVPRYEQPPGDPQRGYQYLITGPYSRLGMPLEAFKKAQPKDTVTLPDRTDDKNRGLSYMFTAAQDDAGADVAAINCLTCHAEVFEGKLIIGLGHAQRMIRTDDINAPGTLIYGLFDLGPVFRATSRVMGALRYSLNDLFPYLASHRDPETLIWNDQQQYFDPNSGGKGWNDVPAWWHMKKKNALYANGAGRGVQGHHMSLQTLVSLEDADEAEEIEKNFHDLAAFIRSVEPPPFPEPIDDEVAAAGGEVFNAHCAICHGTYGKDWTYPNLIIPYAEVGTDPWLATNHWLKPLVAWYNSSWYHRKGDSWLEVTDGYYAPPLDGIWMTAPFFHNGSVPTLEGVIDPEKRPARWWSSMGPGDYDFEQVGWKNKPFDLALTVDLDFGLYDTTRPGYSNQGHTYGASLGADEKRALLEYLKTL